MRLRLAGYPATRLGKLMRATTIEKVVEVEEEDRSRTSTTIEKVVEGEEEDRSRTSTTIEKVVEGEDRRKTFF